VNDPGRDGELLLVRFDRLERRQDDAGFRSSFTRSKSIGNAPHVAEVTDRLTRIKAACDFDDRLLAHTEHDEISLGVEQD
jgi:hypothetical protein